MDYTSIVSFPKCMSACLGLILSCGGTTGADSGDSEASSAGDGDCAMSLCGCWTDTMLDYSATTVDLQTNMPVAGVEVYCGTETEALSTSNTEGQVSLSVEDMVSPGCGYQRCGSLRFHPTMGPYQDHQEPPTANNGGEVAIPYLDD